MQFTSRPPKLPHLQPGVGSAHWGEAGCLVSNLEMFKGCFKKCLRLETCDCCRRGCEQTAKCAFILGVGGGSKVMLISQKSTLVSLWTGDGSVKDAPSWQRVPFSLSSCEAAVTSCPSLPIILCALLHFHIVTAVVVVLQMEGDIFILVFSSTISPLSFVAIPVHPFAPPVLYSNV